MGNLFASLTVKPLAICAGGIILILLVCIGILSWRLETETDRADKAIAKAALCEQNHTVTKSSLNQMEEEMALLVADGAAREHRLAEAVREQRKRSAVIENEVVRIVERTPPPKAAPPCRTPDDILQSGAL